MALDLNNPNVIYKDNKVIIKALPQKGENLSVFVRPGDEVVFELENVDPDSLEYLLIGGDIVVSFPGEGALTFASLGLMGFSGNPPKFNYPGGKFVSVDNILSKIEEVNELPIESVNASFKVRVSDVEEETGLMNKQQVTSQQPIIIIPQTQIDEETQVQEEDFVSMYDEKAEEVAANEEVDENKNSSTSSITSEGISDVSDAAQASLKFTMGFFQTDYEITRSSDPLVATEVLGGGGSKLGNISTSPSAQIEPHTIDLRDEYKEAVIYADSPVQFGANGEYITRLVRIYPEQPEGFQVSSIVINGLPGAFEVLNATLSGTSYSLIPTQEGVSDGFNIVETDSGTALEFYIKYPSNTPISTFSINVQITSDFSLDNVEAGRTIATPDLTQLIEDNDINLQVKETLTASDYVYQSQSGEQGYILNSNLNSNVVYTSQADSTVYGGTATDTVYGQAGNDTIYGRAGNDTLSGGTGTNEIDGGDGSDSLNYDFVDRLTAVNAIEIRDLITTGEFQQIITLLNEGITIDLGTGTASGITASQEYFNAILSNPPSGGVADFSRLMPIFSDTFTNIENVNATNYNDTIYGDGQNNALRGLSGDDYVYGAGGDDDLLGGDGNDYIEGGVDSKVGANLDSLMDISNLSHPDISIVDLYTQFGDFVDGGAGEDTIGFEGINNTAGNQNGVRVFLNTEDTGNSNEAGIAYGGDTDIGVDLIMNVENVIGSNYNDILVGNESNNTLRGLSGADTVVGIGGTNYLYGFKEGFAVSEIIQMINDGVMNNAYYITSGSDTFVRVNNDRDVLKISTNQYTLYKDVITAADNSSFTYSDLALVDSDNIVNLRSSSILATDANDAFYTDGNDFLLGGNGDDYLYGNSGDDTLNGSLGNNYIDGGSGVDTVEFSAVGLNHVKVDLETRSGEKYDGANVLLGTDTLMNIEIVKGTSGNDTLLGNDSNNTLYGGDGDDTLAGRGGVNYLDGEGGNNWVSFSDSQHSATVDLGANPAYGEAVVNGNTSVLYNIDNIIGSNIADTFTGNNNSNTILGGRGDDTISGGNGNNFLDGEDGTNTLSYGYFNNGGGVNGLSINLSSSSVNHGAYTDTIGNFQNLIGTNYNDTLTGNAQNNTIWAGTGDDQLVASLGNDHLLGENGNDTVDYSSINSNVLINLLAGTAQGAGNDVLDSIENAIGGSGNDTLVGSNVTNTLLGGIGNDLLVGNQGNNTLNGGLGEDTADYSWTTTGVNATLVDSPAYGSATGTGINDTLIDIENLIGGSGNDTLSGNSSNNIIWGTSGNNTLSGGAGTNTLFGGTGNDTFIGGSGTDDMRGGGGNDVLTYENITSSVFVNLGENRATGSDISTDTISAINTIIGGSGADTLIGNSANNSLAGGDGNDTLYGGRGDNVLDGGNHRDIVDYSEFTDRVVVNLSSSDYVDTLSGRTVSAGSSQRFGVYEGVDTLSNIEDISGSALDDTLIGNNQNNIIYGNTGRDIIMSTASNGVGANSLYGGEDNDTFIAGAGNDYIDGGTGVDTIDFSQFTATSGINFSLQTNNIQNTGTGGFGTFQVENVERIIGTSFSDLLEGKDSQADTILAGDGNDTVFATSGNDVYDGEGGLNTLDYSNYSGAISADLGLGEINGLATGYDQVSNFIHLIGSTGNDTLLGSASTNNTLEGLDGDDIIDGVGGNNTLIAGAGTDTLIARVGNDTLIGNSDGDWVDYSRLSAAQLSALGQINVTLDSTGTALVDSNLAFDQTLINVHHIIGSGGNDTIIGDSSSVNTIMGYDGNDMLQGGMNSADVLIGGVGDDTFIASSGGDSIDGSEGNNTLLYNTAAVDAIALSTGVYLDLSANRIYRDGFLTDFTQLNGFIDHIDTIQGSTHSDTIYGTSTDNLFYGNGGDDILWGREGADTLYGGSGNDTLDGGENNDILYGESGNNRLIGGSGNDTLYGGSGNDTLEGGEGVDLLDGSLGGNNTFIGGSGNDTFRAGGDRDVLYYLNSESSISVDLTNNTITSDTEGTDTLLSHFEMLMGSNLNDTIDMRGAGAQSTIVANGGNDTIYDAATYNDTIFGGNANDVIYANSGNNSYYGGNAIFDANGDITGSSASGDDRVNYSLAQGGINVDLSINADNTTYNVTNNGFGGQDKLYDITRITGSDYGDIIKGSSGWNEISAGGGDDWIVATNGGDTLRGGTNTTWNGTASTGDWLSFEDIGSSIDATMSAGAITGGLGNTTIFEIENLFGSSVGDVLRGDSNNNTLHGYGGNDAIYGTAGLNFLIGGSGDDTLYTGSGIDKYDGGDVSIGSNYTSSGINGTNTISFYYTNGANVDLGYDNGDGTFGRVINDGYGNTETYIRNINNLTGSLDYSDTLVGNSEDNIISGLGGADVITGIGGENTLYGGTGNDTITAASTKNVGDRGDIVFGGEGTDTLSGSFNSAFLVGGTEAFEDVEGDWVDYSLATNGISLNLQTTTTFTDADGDRASMNGAYSQVFELNSSGAQTGNFDYVRQVEHIIGSTGDDQLMGKHAENNTILAANGDDTLYLSTGQDYLNGENGSDWISLQYMSGAISNFDLANNNAGDSKVYNVENVLDFDGVRSQTVWGSNSANIFIMYDGNDHVLGRNGNDIYDLGAGDDRAANNYGSDTLIGGLGTDTLDMYHNLGSSQGSTVILNDITATTYNGFATGYASLGLSNLAVVTSNLDISGLATLTDGTYSFYQITDGRGYTDYLYNDGGTPDFEQFYLTSRNDTFVGSNNVDTVQGYDGNDLIFAADGNDFIYGGSGDDTIFGVSGNNILEGGSGNDLVFGGLGDDIIRGISGYNTLYGKAGNNQIIGGTNDDIIFAGTGQDSIDGGGGLDTLKFETGGTQGVVVNLGSDAYGGLAAESFINSYQNGGVNQVGTVTNIQNIYGTSLSDTIRGSDERNEIYAGSANDTLIASLGNDEVHGDLGSDLLDFSLLTTTSGISVDLMTQNNAVFSVGGTGYNQTLFDIENITGTAQNDFIKGGLEVDNTFIGGSGNDTLYGIGGTNSLQGGIGDDTIFSGIGNDVIDGGADTDTVDYSYSHNSSISVDLEVGTASSATMNDTLTSIENVTTGSGDDTIRGSSGDNVIHSGAGDDIVYGIGGTNTIYTANGDDTITGGSGVDTIYTQEGDDTIIASVSSDVIDGGSGSDLVDYSSSSTGLNVTLANDGATTTVAHTIGASYSDSISNIEGLKGSSTASNILVGNNLDNTLIGGNLADTLKAVSGDNTLDGGAGNDTLYAGTGSDTLIGGTGTNTANYTDVGSSNINISLRDGSATYSSSSVDALSGISHVIMGEGNDIVEGNQFNNTLDGGNGADILSFSGATGSVTLNVTSDGAGTASGDGADTFSNFEDYLLSSNDDLVNTINVFGSTINGANGTDTLSYASSATSLHVTVDNGNTSASVVGGGNTDTLQSIEKIVGGDADDTFVVSNITGISTLDGDGGVNTLQLSGIGTFDLSNVEILNFDTIIVPNGQILTLDATQLDNETLTIRLVGTGSLIVEATTLATDHDFDNITVDRTGTGTISLHVNNSVDLTGHDINGSNNILDEIKVNSGTVTLSELQVTSGTVVVNGSGSAIIEVSTDSSTDFSSILELAIPANETIEFIANSTFSGDFGNSKILVDADVTLTTTMDKLSGKTANLSGTGNVTLSDANVAASDVDDVAEAVIGVVTATVTSGTASALNTALTNATATDALTLSVTGTAAATDLTALDEKTSVNVGATGVTTITGTQAEVAAINVGTITTATNYDVVLSDSTLSAAAIKTINEQNGTGAINIATVTTITNSTAADVLEIVNDTGSVFTTAANYAVTISDAISAANVNTIVNDTTGTVTANVMADTAANLNSFINDTGGQVNALTLTLSDTSLSSVSNLLALNTKTSIEIDASTNVDSISDSFANLNTLLTAKTNNEIELASDVNFTASDGSLSVANINTLTNNTTGVVTATANTGDATTLIGLTTSPTDAITIVMNAISTSATNLNTIDGKTSVAVNATAITELTGNATDVKTALSSGGITTVTNASLDVIVSETTSVSDINFINSDSAVGVITATANTGDATTLKTLNTGNTDKITINMANVSTSASDLIAIIDKTSEVINASSISLLTGNVTDIQTVLGSSEITLVNDGSLAVEITGAPSVTEINTINSDSAVGVVIATANTGDATTLKTLNTGNTDEITINMAATTTSASDLNTIDTKTGTAINATAITSLTGTISAISTALASSGITTVTDNSLTAILSDSSSDLADIISIANDNAIGTINMSSVTSVTSSSISQALDIVNNSSATYTTASNYSIAISNSSASAADIKTINGDNGTGNIDISNVTTITSSSASDVLEIVNNTGSNFTTASNYNVTLTDATLSSTQLNAIDSDNGTGSITLSNATTINVDSGDTLDLSAYSVSNPLTINDSTGNETIIGTSSADTFNIGSGNDNIDLGGGDDTLNIDFANFNFSDTFDFGGGDDTLSFNTAVSGNLDFSNISDLETINLSASADSLTISGDEPDTINGLGGNDTFALDFSNINNFSIDGGADTDTLSISVSDGNVLAGNFSNFEVLNLSGSGTISIDDLTIDNWSSTSSLDVSINNADYYYSSDNGVTWNQKDVDGALSIDMSTNYLIDFDADHGATDLTLQVI